MNKVNAKDKKKAFTLVELLVVISIIALLLSVLMPSLAKARENARRTVCKSNLHQRGIVEQMYASDFKGNVIPSMAYNMQTKAPTFVSNGVVPYVLWRADYNYVKKSYNLVPKFWMCPGLQLQRNREGAINGARHPHLQVRNEPWIPKQWQKDGDIMPEWNQPQTFVVVGYQSISSLRGFTGSSVFPLSVSESPMNAFDSGNKHIAADINVKWIDWKEGPSVAAHRLKGQSSQGPEGGNRLYLDGRVEWISADKMGYQDASIYAKSSFGKFTWARGQRWCYW